MLLEDAHGVLEDDRVVLVTGLEEGDGGDRRDRSPEEKPLSKLDESTGLLVAWTQTNTHLQALLGRRVDALSEQVL